MNQARPHALTFAIGALLLSTAPLTSAGERAIKDYSFELDGIDRIELHGAVGEMNIIHTDVKHVTVVLEITENDDDDGWFGRDNDIDVNAVELESDVRGNRLVLRQTDKHLNIDWTVELPTVAETSVEFGVGEVDGEFGDTSLRVELGVGDIDLTLPASAVGDIDLSAGVGDARLRGAETEHQDRTFVSQSVSGRGAGNHDLDVEVGVGDIDVRLDD